jgi:hypothetical protein
MYMLAFQNAKERTADDWIALLKGVDLRFELTSVVQPPGSYLAIVEATWQG